MSAITNMRIEERRVDSQASRRLCTTCPVPIIAYPFSLSLPRALPSLIVECGLESPGNDTWIMGISVFPLKATLKGTNFISIV